MSAGLNLHLYSMKKKTSVVISDYTYFGNGHQIVDVLKEWIENNKEDGFKSKLNKLLPEERQSDEFDAYDLASELTKVFHKESCNTCSNILKEKDDIASHWVGYYYDNHQELEDYAGDYQGLMIINEEDTPHFINDLEKGLPSYRENGKINVGLKSFIDAYHIYKKENPEDKLIVLFEEEHVRYHGRSYVLKTGIVCLKDILLSKKFKKYIESLDEETWEDWDTDADQLVRDFVDLKYNWKHKLIKSLLKKDQLNIMHREKVKEHIRYPENKRLEELF